MATLDQISTVPQLREHLGLSSSEADGRVIACRAAAVSRIEKLTGRNILDRDGVSAEAYRTGNGDLAFYVADAVVGDDYSATVRYRSAAADPGFDTPESLTVPRSRIRRTERRVLMRASADGWPDWDSRVPPVAEFAVGMAAAEAGEQIQMAVKFLVREYYEGSAQDELPAGSLVRGLLASYTRGYAAAPEAIEAARLGRG